MGDSLSQFVVNDQDCSCLAISEFCPSKQMSGFMFGFDLCFHHWFEEHGAACVSSLFRRH